jgi:hypothetical protein
MLTLNSRAARALQKNQIVVGALKITARATSARTSASLDDFHPPGCTLACMTSMKAEVMSSRARLVGFPFHQTSETVAPGRRDRLRLSIG